MILELILAALLAVAGSGSTGNSATPSQGTSPATTTSPAPPADDPNARAQIIDLG